MKKSIHTVLGNVEPENIGFTQCHEHIMLSRGRSSEINPALCIDDLEKSLVETAAYRRAGGSALVEAQPGGCCRDSESLTEIAVRSGVHIIASTGFHKLQFYPETHWIRSVSEKDLAEFCIGELTQGMFTGTDQEYRPRQGGAAAGIIKTALDICNLEGTYRALFGAAAIAQAETGATMMVHIEKGSSPLILLDFLRQRGVNLEMVYFCHMDRACGDTDIFLQVLEAGVSLEFDTIGRFKYHSDEAELELMKRVLSWGGGEQLLFSLDTTRSRLKAYDPDAVGLAYILNTFIPAMRKAGISENQIQKISVDNPRRILAW